MWLKVASNYVGRNLRRIAYKCYAEMLNFVAILEIKLLFHICLHQGGIRSYNLGWLLHVANW